MDTMITMIIIYYNILSNNAIIVTDFLRNVCVYVCVRVRVCAQRGAHDFQVQMKLEAVDKRSPGLIRAATVEEVDTHRIKVPPGVCVCVCVCVY